MYQAFNVKSLNGFPVKQFVKCCNFLAAFEYDSVSFKGK